MSYKDREDEIIQSGIGQLETAYKKIPFKLSWTHYQILMRIEDKDERDFYEKEAIRSNWNVSTLKRQFHSSLYERLALSRDKNDVMRLANEGAVPQKHDRYEKIEGENPTIGILLCKQSEEALVDLTLPENANIYAKEYKLYLPDKKLLQKKLKECLIFGWQLIHIQSF